MTEVQSDTLYEKVDLGDYADVNQVTDDDTTYGTPGRSELLAMATGVWKEEIDVVTKGSYSGRMLFIFETGGYYWLLKDSFGSCALCDGLVASDHVDEYAESMIRDAYGFKSPENAKAYLEDKIDPDDEYITIGWKKIAPEGIEIIERKWSVE